MSKDPFNILIVEDELLIGEMLKSILTGDGENVVGIATSYEEVENSLGKHPEINFLILDINLEQSKNGIDIAAHINEKYHIPFMYLTSYSDTDTISKAALTRPECYIIKPFTAEDISATIAIQHAKTQDTQRSIIVKDGRLKVKLAVDDILYIKSENVYLEVFTKEKKLVVRNSLEKFLEELNNVGFVRTHRSYAVNLNKVEVVNGKYVKIGSQKIPLSRLHRDKLRDRFMN